MHKTLHKIPKKEISGYFISFPKKEIYFKKNWIIQDSIKGNFGSRYFLKGILFIRKITKITP